MKINIFISLLLVTFISNSVHAGIVVLNGLTHIHNGELNDEIKGSILVKNNDPEKEHAFILNLKDLDQNCTNNMYMEAGDHQRSLKEWITINTYEMTLGPQEEFIIKYNINVTQNMDSDSLNIGTFWSIIMLEAVDPSQVELEESGVKISTKIRYAIQIIATIGETENPEIEFVNVNVDNEDGINTLFAEIENKNIYLVQPELVLEIFDEFGETLETVTMPAKKIYPHSCKNFDIQIPEIPKGEYYATLIANYDNNMYGTELSIEIKDD
jgi:hypothetical protein